MANHRATPLRIHLWASSCGRPLPVRWMPVRKRAARTIGGGTFFASFVGISGWFRPLGANAEPRHQALALKSRIRSLNNTLIDQFCQGKKPVASTVPCRSMRDSLHPHQYINLFIFCPTLNSPIDSN
jgi:hypothetical protein